MNSAQSHFLQVHTISVKSSFGRAALSLTLVSASALLSSVSVSVANIEIDKNVRSDVDEACCEVCDVMLCTSSV